jgi:transcriptional regulator with XRE-family HTH domain
MKKTIYTREYGVVLRLLREARQEADVTQGQLAKKLRLTQSQFSKFERGQLRLDVVQLRAICQALGLRFPEFIARLERELGTRGN